MGNMWEMMNLLPQKKVHNLVLTKPKPVGKDEQAVRRAYFKRIWLSHLVSLCFTRNNIQLPITTTVSLKGS